MSLKQIVRTKTLCSVYGRDEKFIKLLVKRPKGVSKRIMLE